MSDASAIAALIAPYPQAVQSVVRDAHKTLREWLPEAEESHDVSSRMLVYKYGPGYRGMICTLILSKTGVKLGIVAGAAFPDPHNLLQGVGKIHRHVQLRASADLQQAGLKQLVLAASKACKSRLKDATAARKHA